jgi:hypothetical protein
VKKMAICPYCEAEIHIEDFFEQKIKKTKKGEIKKKIGLFKGEALMMMRIKMWACPSCDKILGFSEYGD